MSDDKPKKETGKVLSMMRDAEKNRNKGPRFMPSGIGDSFPSSRVRKWEPYQVQTYRMSLKRLGITKADDLTCNGQKERKRLAKMLQTCLVGSAELDENRIPCLVARGAAGLNKILETVPSAELLAAVKTNCEFSGVFQDPVKVE